MGKFADWAYGRPGSTALLAMGFTGVIRYLSYTPAKNIDRTEYLDYVRAGLKVHVVWENGANDAAEGYSVGVTNAAAALALVRELVGTTGFVPIYFAVDFDAVHENKMDQVLAYFKGVVSIIPSEYVGIYGSANVVAIIGSNLNLRYGWQTVAWSNGKVAPGIALFQSGQQQTVNGIAVDLNRVYSDTTGAINVGYVDDLAHSVDNQFPGLNPSNVATGAVETLRVVRALADPATGTARAAQVGLVGVAVQTRADSLAAQLDDIHTLLTNLTVPAIDYDKLARALLAAVLAPKEGQ